MAPELGECAATHNLHEKTSIYLFIRFLHINLESHESTPSSFLVKSVHILIHKNDVILDSSTRNEGKLGFGNKLMDDHPEPIGTEFGDNFVDNVEKVDGATV